MDSTTPLLRTKLTRLEMATDLVPRSRLQELLQSHPERSCTLVSAPAGYGKSTLVSSWLDASEVRVSWLSLDEQDDDARRFFSYLIAAVRTIDGGSCRSTEEVLEAHDLPPAAVLASYLNMDLETLGEPIILVLDDYHRIHNQTIHDVINRLLEHPPRLLHLVLVTRHDPPFPLGRMRARSDVVEIREEDLRFNLEETRAAIQKIAGVEITDETLNHLHTELEGWIVGLRLVCLALRHQADGEGYLRALRGGTRTIQEYLLEEVLGRQSAAFQRCLMSTSILNRFCAPLCEALCGDGTGTGALDAVTEGGIEGEAFLRDLERANLFAIRLDESGRWMRYHHQFQQLLQWQLQSQRTPEEIAALHDRASQWFEDEGLLDEALEHAVRIGNFDRAARLIEKHRVDMLNDDRWYVLERWLERLPDSIRRQRPDLLLVEAWSAYERFQFDRLASALERIDSLLDGEAPAPSVSGEYLLLRGELHYWAGEGEAARRYFESARKELPERHGLVRGLLELQYGLALCMDGEKERALEILSELAQEVGTPEGIYLSRLVAGLYFIHQLSASPFPARIEATRLRVVAQRSNIVYTEAWSSYMEACTHLHANEPGQAQTHFTDAVRRRYILHSRAAVDALAGLALAQQLLQQEGQATETLEMLQNFALELSDGQYLAVAHSCRARLALLRQDVASAFEWARSVEAVSAPAELFMWLEVPVITQARVLIAEGSAASVDRALDLLSEVGQQSEACCFVNQTIEATTLQALALQSQGRRDQALERLAQALDLAEPGGWARPFVEAGPPMAELLAEFSEGEKERAFVQELRLVLQQPATTVVTPAGKQTVNQELIEPLTNRQLDVLELLADRLYDKEIAKALSISVDTVKTHLKHIYAKLEVSNRREAVGRAEELGLLQ